jgi:hypothetical protein
VDLRPLIEQKIKEFGAFSEKLGFGWVGDKMGILGIGVAGGGWIRWWGRCGSKVGGWILDLWEERDGGAGMGGCTAGGENGGKKGKIDLKAGLDGPKTEYVRT